MRTKTLLLTAVLGLASAATSMAQVYSANVVGYVNRPIPSQYSIIANPLTATNNTLASLIAAPPVGSRAYRFVSGVYQISNYELDDNNVAGWSINFSSLLPGEGLFIFNNGAAFTNTFVGEVSIGTTTNAIVSGFNLKGSKVPQSAALDSVLGYAPVVGDAVYLFRSGGYIINNYELDDNNVPGWSLGSAPVPEVGEGFFIRSINTKVPGWVRTFNP